MQYTCTHSPLLLQITWQLQKKCHVQSYQPAATFRSCVGAPSTVYMTLSLSTVTNRASCVDNLVGVVYTCVILIYVKVRWSYIILLCWAPGWEFRPRDLGGFTELFRGNTHYSQCLSQPTRVLDNYMLGGTLPWTIISSKGRVEILLVASCYRNSILSSISSVISKKN